MVPFRVFDQEKKAMWIVLNFHPGSSEAKPSYLIAREDESNLDGQMELVSPEELSKYRLIDFLDQSDGFSQ